MTSTHAPGVMFFAAEVVICVTKPDGSHGIEMNHISFPCFGDPFTITSAVESVSERFKWQCGFRSRDSERFMGAVISSVLGSVLYLARKTLDDNRDSECVAPFTVKKSLGVNKPPFSFYRVGWQIDTALSNSRPNTFEASDPAPLGKPGHAQDPQHHRAHFKTVWTGKGRRVAKTVFVAPTGPTWISSAPPVSTPCAECVPPRERRRCRVTIDGTRGSCQEDVMPAPARAIMDRLHSISEALWLRGEHGQRSLVEVLIEVANRAGHTAYTWKGVSDEVLRAMDAHTAQDLSAYNPQTVAALNDALDRDSENW